MKRIEHGNVNSERGWEVDHVRPVARGGNDELPNLRWLLSEPAALGLSSPGVQRLPDSRGKVGA